jgi:BirA family biotin operon repressor/biotin-[acetyl-CoA-carboxylase] ligase
MQSQPVASRLAAALPARHGLAQHVVELANCASTQDEAKRAGAPAGTLWFAHEQSAGRGRTARDWWSGPPGANLAVSLVVGQALQPPPLSLVAAACALAATLDRFGAGPAAVKWPNDVLLGGRKVAGLIGEWIGGHPPRVLLGAGVNVDCAPPSDSVRRPATSVNDVLAARGLFPAKRVPLLADMRLGLERRLERTQRCGPAALEEEFLRRLRWWAPAGVRTADDPHGGPLLEFRFASGLAWEAEGRVQRRNLASIPDLIALP